MAEAAPVPPIVHVVDDDESLRDALGSLFRSVGLTPRLYGSAKDFLDRVDPAVPGCIVLDIRLPGTSGLDFQVQLAESGIGLPVILMTGHGDIPMSVRGMK
ncbi:MAG: response regulator, partial [Sphingomonadaceae bacterium]|nr:response regulator [Sphingomonadaceae bacterium]